MADCRYKLFLLLFVLNTSILYGQDLFPDNVIEDGCYSLLSPLNTNNSISTVLYSNISLSSNITPMIGDLDEDGIPDIVVAQAHNILVAGPLYIYFGKDRSNPVCIDLSTGILRRHISPIGLVKTCIRSENKVMPIIAVVLEGMIKAYDPISGKELWTSSHNYMGGSDNFTFAYESVSIGFADFNGDGQPEIYVGRCIFDASTGEMLICNSSEYQAHSKDMIMPFAADLDGDGIPEYLAGGAYAKVDLANRSLYWRKHGGTYRRGIPAVADIDGDGKLDVVYCNEDLKNRFTITAYNPRTLTVMGSQTVETPIESGSIMSIGDVDGDGKAEILKTTINKIHILGYNNGFTSLATLPLNLKRGSSGISLFDFDLDGRAEIIVKEDANIARLEYKGGVLSKKNSFAMNGTNDAIYGMAVIADIDNDEKAEIIAVGYSDQNNSLKNSLVIAKSSIDQWAPARPVWNQYAYNSLNVNNNLTIPIRMFDPAYIFPGSDDILGTSDDVQHFNGFMKQHAWYDIKGRPAFPRPQYDLVSWEFQEDPANDRADLWFCIKNTGSSNSSGPLYVSLQGNCSWQEKDCMLTTTYTVLPKPGESKCYNLGWINNFSAHKVSNDCYFLIVNKSHGSKPSIKTCKGTSSEGFYLYKLNYDTKLTHAHCSENNGSINIIPSSGKEPYRYNLNGGSWVQSNEKNYKTVAKLNYLQLNS